ncbi:MAG: hypothetical protein EBV31_08955 [Verrucomicrobia bacterium]|nr:hypothetical protein [Verrucomicrobiota bacterium]
MIRALRQLVVTWGALALPLFVCAHNGEFLLAKLTLRTDGTCVLRVTVDTEANFNIQDRAQLAKAAEGMFLVSALKETTTLSKLAGEPTFLVSLRAFTSLPFLSLALPLSAGKASGLISMTIVPSSLALMKRCSPSTAAKMNSPSGVLRMTKPWRDIGRGRALMNLPSLP